MSRNDGTGMNKNYIINDDKVIVIDEYGNNKIVEYTDNINEVLAQENLVEYIEDEIKRYEYNKKEHERLKKEFPKYLKKNDMYIPKLSVPLDIIMGIICGIGTGNIEDVLILILGFIVLAEICICIPCEGILFSKYKDAKRHVLMKEIEYEELKKILVKEKEKLEELRSVKEKNLSIEELKSDKVNDEEKLRELIDKLYLYRALSDNIKYYYKRYENDKLESYFNNHSYSEEQMSLISNFLEEHGKELVKTKKSK